METGRRSAIALAVLAAAVLLLHAADLASPVSIAGRSLLRPLYLALSLAALSYALSPLVVPLRLAGMVRTIETRSPRLRQELSTAWETATRRNGRYRGAYSDDLVRELQQRTLDRLRETVPSSLFPADRWSGIAAGAALLAVAVVVLISPRQFALTIARLARPAGIHGEWLSRPVRPGSVRIAAGQQVRISAGAERFEVVWRDHGGATGRAVAQNGSAELAVGDRSVSYRVVRRREQSPAYDITVYRPLVLSDLRLRIVPPAYARRPPAVLENQGDIDGLRGSLVTLTATATQPVCGAGMVLDDGTVVAGSIGSDSLIAVAHTLRGPGAYRLWAGTIAGDTLVGAQRYTIAVQDDAPPMIVIDAPEPDHALDASLAVDVAGRAGDDFGLTAIALWYEVRGERAAEPIGRFGGAVADTAFAYRWSLGGLSLLPGDSVVYWAEVRDNDAVSGPKTSRSPVRILRLPTLDDVFRQQELADSSALRALADVAPAGRDITRELERLSQAIKESRTLQWQHKAALQDAVAQQQRLLEEMQRAADQALAQAGNDPARFSFDAETVQKMRELRQLFDQTATEEMRRQMDAMRAAIERADRAAVERATEQLKLSQQELKQRLDMAIAGLKELQRQRHLDLIQQQADQLLAEQREVRQQTTCAGSDRQRQDAARRQERLAQDTESLGDKMRQRAEELEPVDPDAALPLRNAAAVLRQNRTAETMNRAAGQIRGQQGRQADAAQQQAISDLSQISAGTRQAAAGMRGRRAGEEAAALRRKASQAVRLSQQQEALNRQLGEVRSAANDLADRQQSLERAAARLKQDLEQGGGRSTPMPQAGSALARALQQMQGAGRSAATGDGPQAGSQGRASQEALNQAAIALMQGAARRSGADGSGDMQSELEGLSSRQQELNGQSGQLVDLEQEARLQAMQAQIPRLAAEQEAIRQGLREFNERYADRADRAGRTDDLVREMERAVADLRQGRVTRETQQRQERILTRMLDAQRSLQERDHSRQRQAQSAGTPARQSTGAPVPSRRSWTASERWRDWRSLPYPLEYRRMLETYFRSLGQ
ncbi:MAG: hypothetical protein MUF78_05750 [Candidatus Edwardsbacteria bacterium]|nr:hypothetical protein [Candidatus Edwardsbacteria bacterium]